ncbi:putative nucleoporin pom152 [Lyophyllum shimeji]|uniref:Nucleoporin pom152 n=1 Tax=Lyophyllum shimeji TaxID=47721 RepID=A0A9P3PI41_LYOSH|nr:putative nucleoporin pom152 [Lyophyllum shimeji]
MSAPEQKPSPGAPPAPQPLIPEKYLDVPSQRLYYLSLGLLCQAIKLIDFSRYLVRGEEGLAICRKWLFVDFAYCAILNQLRIPRLTYSKAIVLLQIALLWFLDGLMFGGISLNLPFRRAGFDSLTSSNIQEFSSTPAAFNLFDYVAPLTFGLLSAPGQKDGHLLGQHTVRMSPISTAQLNPQGLSFCLSPPDNFVLIPVLLNNTHLAGLTYSLTPLGRDEKPEIVELTAKDLKAIEQDRLEALQASRPTVPARDSDDYDEYDDEEEAIQGLQSPLLQNTQALVHIRLSRPGTLRLESVVDHSHVQARLSQPSTVTVVPCPTVEFADDDSIKDNVRCSGPDSDLQLTIQVVGVPPLSLRWLKTINGRREHFLVEGIEDNGRQDQPATGTTRGAVQELKIPLTISLDTPGTYLYALEEVMDSVGNVVRVGSDASAAVSGSASQTKTTRSLVVLRRPTVSFTHCRPGSPTSLLIGSEAVVNIAVNDADEFDSPWEISLEYQPPLETEGGGKGNKRYKPWKKTFKTQGNRRSIDVRANAPGDYVILGVQGKWCSGDVLAPETCKVVEKPLPSAEIKWKRIHECSGDTGVSASLVLYGTPPFQVYYTVQRDNEPPRELSKTFASSRGELTLQPERSGHYKFTFTRLSDTNYKQVELKGPSIDQVIHPLAAADFVTAQAGTKRRISSCDGGDVSVDVDLRGTGPWNLEMQVVSPRGSETFEIQGIETARKTIKIPIPKGLESDGGTFEINIVSIEDAYKCKRPVSVPGISVDVRAVKPTAKFYVSGNKRHVTVLENEPASLPLRLTGDGPWRIKYRQQEDSKVMTRTLTNPNDNLIVTQKGLYELVEVADAHCPGAIITEASTYEVKWVPRPSAKLSPQTRAFYEPHNGSHILPAVCEGTADFVELDLQGRPPFQIMYNIAQNDNGGTRVIDQPILNSIQPHTRFQLQTLHPGRMYYEVKQIGDAEYPLTKHKNAVIPRNERLLFEQQIYMRPSARFRNRNRASYCLNDPFTPLDGVSPDRVILFHGTPPFTLKLSIKNVGTSQVETVTVDVFERTWKVDLPSYTFKAIGPHLVTIESVHDASNCAPAALDPLSSSIWVDVAETAAIIPFDRRVDYCVGEVIQFQLEGTPPWNIGYRINGKSYTHEAKVSPFALLQQQSGEFTITSIAHQQKLCKATVADLHFTVHPLPSAQVGHGKRIYQDIHEGDQAEIVFTLIGEPPFTFTYQRSEPSSKKGGRPGKVLETHTVSRVMTNEYSLFSALEGTWTVTSISDRYCRYPSAQPDLAVEKRP